MDSGHTLESIKSADGYYLGVERKRKIKDDSNGFVTSVKMALSLIEFGRGQGKWVCLVGWWEKSGIWFWSLLVSDTC